jgi:hypothetical protein
VRHAEKDDYSLVLAYWHTVQPALKSSSALELLFGALARTSINEAFSMTRTHPPHARRMLFEKLIASVLDGKGGKHAANRAVELISLPLDETEEQWFEEYLSTGEGKGLKRAKDTMLMRKVATGRYSEAAIEKGLSGQWAPILDGLKSGIGEKADS